MTDPVHVPSTPRGPSVDNLLTNGALAARDPEAETEIVGDSLTGEPEQSTPAVAPTPASTGGAAMAQPTPKSCSEQLKEFASNPKPRFLEAWPRMDKFIDNTIIYIASYMCYIIIATFLFSLHRSPACAGLGEFWLLAEDTKAAGQGGAGRGAAGTASPPEADARLTPPGGCRGPLLRTPWHRRLSLSAACRAASAHSPPALSADRRRELLEEGDCDESPAADQALFALGTIVLGAVIVALFCHDSKDRAFAVSRPATRSPSDRQSRAEAGGSRARACVRVGSGDPAQGDRHDGGLGGGRRAQAVDAGDCARAHRRPVLGEDGGVAECRLRPAPHGWWEKGRLAKFDDTAPSARQVPAGAEAAPTHPRAQPEQLTSMPRPQKPASGRPKG